MSIYGYEQPIQYTPEKIFNPTTANMVLTSMKNYADAVEREYVRALEEEKEFFKDYGNFYSSVPGAMEAYYNAGPGKVMNEINAAREGGIDLLRSLEGRNKIRGMIRGANIGIMKQLEAQNNMYGTYMKGLLDAVFKGMLTPEQAQWKMQHDNVAGFTALDKDGNVRQFGASPLIGPFEDTNAFLKRVAGDIEDTYMGMEGAYDVNGVGYKKLKDAIGMSLPEYLRTDGGRFAYETFVKLVSGLDMSKLPQDQQELLMNDKEMYNKFGNAIFQQGLAKYGHKDVKLNEVAKMDIAHKYAVDMENLRHSHNIEMEDIRYNHDVDEIGRGSGSGSLSGSGSGISNGGSDFAYSHQQKYLNLGLSKLLNIPVTTASINKANSYNVILQNQTAAIKASYNKDTKQYNEIGALNTLSVLGDLTEIPKILGLTQTGDDKSKGRYTISDQDLNHIYSAHEIFRSVLNEADSYAGTPAHETNESKNIRSFARKAGNGNYKIVPTGLFVTYMRKDGTLKQMAKMKLYIHKKTDKTKQTTNDQGESVIVPVYDNREIIVYMDMGNVSTKVTNDANIPINIDRNRSTLHSASWYDVSKGYAKPSPWDYGVQTQQTTQESE